MKPYFIHSTAKSGRKFTLAAYVDKGKQAYYLRIGVALCSKQDQFVKLTGRNKALGRAKSSKILLILPKELKNINKYMSSIRKSKHIYGREFIAEKFIIKINKKMFYGFPQSCKNVITKFIQAYTDNN